MFIVFVNLCMWFMIAYELVCELYLYDNYNLYVILK
jgi:hypothetical protein